MPRQRTAGIGIQTANRLQLLVKRQRSQASERAARHDSRQGNAVNPVHREKKLIRRELGLRSSRAWRRWKKAAERADRLAMVVGGAK